MTEPKVIGEGTYGCVHRPPLQCSKDLDLFGKKVNYDNTISKVLELGDFLDEINQYSAIEKIDKQKKYYTGVPTVCVPEKNKNFYGALDGCKFKGEEYKRNDVRLLLIKDGGVDLGDFAKGVSNMDPNNPDGKRIVNDFWWEMVRILEGIRFFLKKKVIHFDLKEKNIVYDAEKHRANFIDFGTFTEKKRVEELVKRASCYHCTHHWSYPFETYFLNRDNFDEDYKTENVKLFLPILNDVFTVGFDIEEDLDIKKKIANNPTRKKLLLEKSKKADSIPSSELNHRSQIVVLFGELKSHVFPHLMEDYLKDIKVFLEQHSEWDYQSFIDKSLDTFDIYGLGIAFLYVLKRIYKFMNPAFFDDMYSLVYRMVTPNLKERYTIEPLLRDYLALLEKHISKNSTPPVSLKKNNTTWDDKKCPEGKVINPATGRCIKEKVIVNKEIPKKVCPEGKVINPATGRCIKEKTAAVKNVSEPSVKENPFSKLTPPVTLLKVCPEGKVLNPATGRCIKIKTAKNKKTKQSLRKTRVLPPRTPPELSLRKTRVLPPRS